MLIGLALLACLISVPLTGGSLERLSHVRFAATRALLAAIAIQVVVISIVPGGWPLAHQALHVVSYVLAGWFVWANRRLAGVPIMALGGGLNALAIAANGGVMPASRSALHHAGLPVDTGGFANSTALAHPHLAFLGDVFATPSGLFFSNVFSIGDVVLIAGALVGLHVAARREPASERMTACLPSASPSNTAPSWRSRRRSSGAGDGSGSLA